MFDEKVENALWVVDVAKGKKKAAGIEELTKVVIYSTKILRLYEMEGKLNGWARYVHDKTNSILGKEAKLSLRAARKEALSRLAAYSPEELKSIKNSLKEEYIGLRVIDLELEIRPNFYKILNTFINDPSLKYYRLALATPSPLNVLVSDLGYMLVATDNFYLPIETIKEFENENDAYIFFANFTMLILYAKQKKLFEAKGIVSDKFASKYLKESYRIFSKSIKDEKKANVAELIKEGNLWDAIAELQMDEKFYNAFRNMWNVNLVSFGYGELKINSFIAETTFSVDKYGLEKMAEAFEKNKNSTKEYFIGICYLNAAIQDYLIDKRVYLSRELEPILPQDTELTLPIKITAECTADWKPIIPRNNLPCSIFAIKNIYIETADNKFISLRKAPQDFEEDPINGSIAKIELYSSEEKEEFFKGGILFMPEFFGILSAVMIKRKIDKEVVEYVNLNPAYRKFNFVSEKEKKGISGYFTNYVIEKIEERG